MGETRYAKCGDVNIAYQVMGSGPIDLVYVSGWLAHLEVDMEFPRYAAFAERLASFARLIRFDKRGTGMSDREVGTPTWPARVDDLRAVVDAVGSERVALFGLSEGGPIASLFASMHPERVSALILCNTALAPSADPAEVHAGIDELRRLVDTGWGTGVTLEVFAPEQATSERARQGYARYERMTSSPGTALAYLDKFEAWLSQTWTLPPPTVPTLVLHNTGDVLIPVEAAKATAALIPDARFVEIPGQSHLPWLGDVGLMCDEIQHFLTGVRDRPQRNRFLSTVLFVDIVQSTTEAASVGDTAWRVALDHFDGLVERQLDRFAGDLVKSTGDGALALFDSPTRAVQCARAIADGTAGIGLQVRCGLHTGEVEQRGDDIAGIAIHVANRICDVAEPGQVLVSSTVKELAFGSGLQLVDTGRHPLKGVPDTWQLFDANASAAHAR